MGLRHPGPLWGAQLAWSTGRKAASVAAVNWGRGRATEGHRGNRTDHAGLWAMVRSSVFTLR